MLDYFQTMVGSNGRTQSDKLNLQNVHVGPNQTKPAFCVEATHHSLSCPFQTQCRVENGTFS